MASRRRIWVGTRKSLLTDRRSTVSTRSPGLKGRREHHDRSADEEIGEHEAPPAAVIKGSRQGEAVMLVEAQGYPVAPEARQHVGVADHRPFRQGCGAGRERQHEGHVGGVGTVDPAVPPPRRHRASRRRGGAAGLPRSRCRPPRSITAFGWNTSTIRCRSAKVQCQSMGRTATPSRAAASNMMTWSA